VRMIVLFGMIFCRRLDDMYDGFKGRAMTELSNVHRFSNVFSEHVNYNRINVDTSIKGGVYTELACMNGLGVKYRSHQFY